jgi:hypothetical protein
MEVTKDNFFRMLPLIKESIQSADFITFDSEFSGKDTVDLNNMFVGLSESINDRHNEFDSVEDRYQKLVHVCSRMAAL